MSQLPFGSGELVLGVGEFVFEVADPLSTGAGGHPCGGEVVLDLALELMERRRDLAARCRSVRSMICLGEVPVLDCCGGVGAVVG